MSKQVVHFFKFCGLLRIPHLIFLQYNKLQKKIGCNFIFQNLNDGYFFQVPTTSLLQTIATKLQSFLSTKSELADSFSVTSNQEKARIEVKANAGSSICVHVGITSPSVRASDDESKFSDDSLPKDRCLEHLADIRHAKW